VGPVQFIQPPTVHGIRLPDHGGEPGREVEGAEEASFGIEGLPSPGSQPSGHLLREIQGFDVLQRVDLLDHRGPFGPFHDLVESGEGGSVTQVVDLPVDGGGREPHPVQGGSEEGLEPAPVGVRHRPGLPGFGDDGSKVAVGVPDLDPVPLGHGGPEGAAGPHVP